MKDKTKDKNTSIWEQTEVQVSENYASFLDQLCFFSGPFALEALLTAASKTASAPKAGTEGWSRCSNSSTQRRAQQPAGGDDKDCAQRKTINLLKA